MYLHARLDNGESYSVLDKNILWKIQLLNEISEAWKIGQFDRIFSVCWDGQKIYLHARTGESTSKGIQDRSLDIQAHAHAHARGTPLFSLYFKEAN